eukprot:364238-Chlamydomonas_euryale.AAC.11
MFGEPRATPELDASPHPAAFPRRRVYRQSSLKYFRDDVHGALRYSRCSRSWRFDTKGSTLHANGMRGRAFGQHRGDLAGVCAFVRGVQTARPSMENDPFSHPPDHTRGRPCTSPFVWKAGHAREAGGSQVVACRHRPLWTLQQPPPQLRTWAGSETLRASPSRPPLPPRGLCPCGRHTLLERERSLTSSIALSLGGACLKGATSTALGALADNAQPNEHPRASRGQRGTRARPASFRPPLHAPGVAAALRGVHERRVAAAIWEAVVRPACGVGHEGGELLSTIYLAPKNILATSSRGKSSIDDGGAPRARRGGARLRRQRLGRVLCNSASRPAARQRAGRCGLGVEGGCSRTGRRGEAFEGACGGGPKHGAPDAVATGAAMPSSGDSRSEAVLSTRASIFMHHRDLSQAARRCRCPGWEVSAPGGVWRR